MPENDNHSFATPNILHDWPLPEGQGAQFKFTEYAVTLSRLIADKKTATPLTLGVSGAWGTGKTTLLQRIKAMLDETRSLLEPEKPGKLSFINQDEKPSDYRVCRTVWFNAGKYADEEQLLVALVRVIVQAMAEDDVVSKLMGKLLDPSYPRRDVVNTVLGWFSIKTPVGVEVKLSAGTPQPTPFAEKTAILDLFDEAFNRLMAAWVHHLPDRDRVDDKKGVLVVFIDDLDRCLPAKMVQVLEAIKLFMDKRGCVFVLGADKDIIQQAVEKQYEGVGVKGQTASDYLEKVIQLRFHLPPIDEKEMDSFVHQQIEDEVLKTHWRIVALGAESNPRKVKTFLNDLQLQWAIWKNTGQSQGVNFDDFVRWEVLMRSAPAFRKRIYGIYDAEMRARLLGSAFEWAAGKEEAAASFKADLNEQLQRVLKDIEQHKAHFDHALITKLVFLVAPAPVTEEKPVVTIQPKSIESAEEVGHPGVTGTTPVHFGLEPELEEATAKGPVTRGEKQPSTVNRPPTSDDKRMTIGGIEFVKIPAGRFLMGSKDDNKLAYADEKPQHTVEISQDYWMARFPVTNEQYHAFLQEKGEVNPVTNWQKVKIHPITNVSWKDALAYCEWFDRQYRSELGQLVLRLPTEAEWEKAARGEYGNEWPWGNEFDPAKCNSGEGKKGGTTPVGAYSPRGDSPYGCADMGGNVWEWTHTLWKGYPYNAEDGREDEKALGSSRVVRGGSFLSLGSLVRCAYRLNNGLPNDLLGFRVVAAHASLNA